MAETGPKHISDFTADSRWMDYNGHMNIAYYTVALDKTMDDFFAGLGIGETYARKENRSTFMLQNHTRYLREIREGQQFSSYLQLLGLDSKRFHAFVSLIHADGTTQLAISEVIGMHVDLETRKPIEFPDQPYDVMSALFAEHQALPVPKFAGRGIGIADN